MIYIDVSAAVHSRAGLGRYSQAMAQALHAARPDQVALFYNQGRDGQLPGGLAQIPHRRVKLGYKPWRMLVLMGQYGHLDFQRAVPDATLFHSTEHLLLPLRKVPTILTVHDLIFKLFPTYHKKLNYIYLNQAMPLFCQRASAIIAVSQTSKQDIVDHYGVDPAKIHVVYEAAADHFKPPKAEDIARIQQRYQLPDRYLVHLSTIEPRKNLDRLVDALQIVRRQDKDLKLILVGAKGWLYDDFFARLAADGLDDIVGALGWVPDEDLPAVIAGANLAVQPSLYEGFGLPILEHMACGQIVAASNTSSHPEVGGQAAAYFEATDAEEMATVIGRLLSDPGEMAHRRALGLKQAAQFSWQRAAAETLAIYDQLLSS